MSTQKVWLITGCSSGIGEALAEAALAHGDKVIATARNQQKLTKLASLGAVTASLDVTSNDEAIRKTIESLLPQVGGRIDILVNNAGYILYGGLEECSDAEVQQQFDTNVFGPLRVLRAVLPVMRAQRSGTVAMVGSLVSWYGTPATGVYAATKGSDSLIAEALRAENEHLGIRVTSIELGAFRTKFLTSGNRIRAERRIDDLAKVTDAMTETYDAADAAQPNDPVKGAKLIVEALTGDRELPVRLPLGQDVYDAIEGRIDLHRKNMEAWRDLATNLGCDD